MNITYLSLPYVYPLCPLNFNHAKMFVIADVFARHAKTNSPDSVVIFPVASHFTGNTAQSTANAIKEYNTGNRDEDVVAIYKQYRNYYDTPQNVLCHFDDSDYLMRYFHEEILWELKCLNVSCDYRNSYTTKSVAFECFVRSIIRQYEKEHLLVFNSNHELAVNYDDTKWRTDTLRLINTTDIRKKNQLNNIISAFNTLSSGWELLRKTGYGVVYKDTGLIIDPMFDSELFMVYDLFNYWRNYYQVEINNYDDFFDTLFLSLKENQNKCSYVGNPEKKVVQGILDSLPCDMFFGEEHLKNWICKKFFAEQRLLHPSLRTSMYRILGMGLLEGKRMSASAGHSVLSKDLINEFGGQVARLTILLSGGNISNGYNYEKTLPDAAKRILKNFSDYWVFLNSDFRLGNTSSDVEKYVVNIENNISEGYLCKAVTDLLVNIPAKNKHPSLDCKQKLLSLYRYYLPIFLPEFSLCQMQ